MEMLNASGSPAHPEAFAHEVSKWLEWIGNPFSSGQEKKLSQGDIEKRTGLLRCYISRVENGHTVPAIETLEKRPVVGQLIERKTIENRLLRTRAWL